MASRLMGSKLSRNSPCWCNSGKRYKHCHFESDKHETLMQQGGVTPELIRFGRKAAAYYRKKMLVKINEQKPQEQVTPVTAENANVQETKEDQKT